jgi:hypothetical protein
LESRTTTRAQSPRAAAAVVQDRGPEPNDSVTFLALSSPYTLSALPAHLQQHGGYGELGLIQGGKHKHTSPMAWAGHHQTADRRLF